jgi:hypothetical protein
VTDRTDLRERISGAIDGASPTIQADEVEHLTDAVMAVLEDEATDRTDLRKRLGDAIRDNLKRRTFTPPAPFAGGGGFGLTEYDLADVVLAELRPELDQRDRYAALLAEFVQLADVTHQYRSQGGHDVIGVNLTCAGCDLAARVRTALEQNR